MTSKHILVIEDEDLLRDAITNSLLDDGYQVSQASSSEDGMRILEERNIDLLALDLMLPGRDGFDLISDLRAWKKTSKMPIIVVTARDAISHRVTGLDLGADDYLTKPFALTELKARIRAHLRQSREKPQNLEFSELRLDLSREMVHKKVSDDQWDLIPLRPREFDILSLLASNEGLLISREEILIHIFSGEKESVMQNVVDVHIYNLRRKIGASWIRSVYKGGFRFLDPNK